MKKIYIVTSGEYSDYGIDAVFTDKELAEKFIKEQKGEIEVWEANEYTKIPQNRDVYQVIIYVDNGEIQGTEKTNSNWHDALNDNMLFWRKICGIERGRLVIYCFAKDREHAIKIANEKRVQYKQLHNL